jgi:hypothetical protein
VTEVRFARDRRTSVAAAGAARGRISQCPAQAGRGRRPPRVASILNFKTWSMTPRPSRASFRRFSIGGACTPEQN